MDKKYWKSLGYSLLVANVTNLVVMGLHSAFGHPIDVGFSFLVTNVIALLYWLFRIVAPRF